MAAAPARAPTVPRETSPSARAIDQVHVPVQSPREKSSPPPWGCPLCSPIMYALGWWLGLSVLVFGGQVRAADAAEKTKEAARSYAALDYQACQKAALASLKLPGTAEMRVEGYMYLGLCRAALDDTEAARDAFAAMLAIDPKATLPEGLSPRFTSSYLEAKGEWVGKPPMSLQIESEANEGGTRIIRIAVVDPLEMIDQVVWESDDGDRGTPLKAAERMEIEVPAKVATRLVALDKAGGALSTLSLSPPKAPEPERKLAPPPPPPVDEVDEAAEDEGSGLLTSLIVVGAGAVAATVVLAAAAGGGVGVYYAAFREPDTVTLKSSVRFGD